VAIIMMNFATAPVADHVMAAKFFLGFVQSCRRRRNNKERYG
jgi:hypothetical protein